LALFVELVEFVLLASFYAISQHYLQFVQKLLRPCWMCLIQAVRVVSTFGFQHEQFLLDVERVLSFRVSNASVMILMQNEIENEIVICC
jgi:hypothetical protein